MAADIKNDSKSIDKLKELEANIARELDQKVRLSEPTDPRLDGSVQVNPSLQPKPTSTPSPEGQKATGATSVGTVQNVGIKSAPENQVNAPRKVDDITLDEVDSLLSEEDENFGTVMNDVKSEVGGIQFQQGMESISIGADILNEAEEEAEAEAKEEIKLESNDQILVGEEFFSESEADAPPEDVKNFWTYLFATGVSVLKLPVELGIAIPRQLLELRILPPKQVLTDIFGIFKSVFQIRINLVKEFIAYISEFGWQSFVKAGILILLIFGLYFMIQDIKNFNQHQVASDPFLKSFGEVADQKVKLQDEKTEGEPIPQYVVSLPRMVANLKSLTPHRQSMVGVELYIEASERESIVEIKNRELEVRDIIARILEQMTYQDLDSIEGKEKFKLRVKLALNQFLNNGRVHAVFFKSFQISQ